MTFRDRSLKRGRAAPERESLRPAVERGGQPGHVDPRKDGESVIELLGPGGLTGTRRTSPAVRSSTASSGRCAHVATALRASESATNPPKVGPKIADLAFVHLDHAGRRDPAQEPEPPERDHAPGQRDDDDRHAERDEERRQARPAMCGLQVPRPPRSPRASGPDRPRPRAQESHVAPLIARRVCRDESPAHRHLRCACQSVSAASAALLPPAVRRAAADEGAGRAAAPFGVREPAFGADEDRPGLLRRHSNRSAAGDDAARLRLVGPEKAAGGVPAGQAASKAASPRPPPAGAARRIARPPRAHAPRPCRGAGAPNW